MSNVVAVGNLYIPPPALDKIVEQVVPYAPKAQRSSLTHAILRLRWRLDTAMAYTEAAKMWRRNAPLTVVTHFNHRVEQIGRTSRIPNVPSP